MSPTTQMPAAPARTPVAALPRTMKAVVKAAAGPGAEIRDVPVPTCGPGDLLLKVLRAGVCGTDLHIYEWDRWAQDRVRVGVTTGHEFVGEIVAIGAEVAGFRVGERVACESH